MLTARRITTYTAQNHADRLTPRQRRRAVHKANRLDAKARAVALAAIAVLVAGCSAGRISENRVTATAGPPALDPRGRHGAPQTTTTAPVPANRSAPPAASRRRVTTAPAPGGGDFWARLSGCESPHGASGRYVGYFQFSQENAARYGITPSTSYEDQRAAAQDLAAHSDPHHQWPVCWARAGG